MIPFLEAVEKVLPAHQIKDSLLDRYAFAPDASFYYLLPKIVVQPATVEEIKGLFGIAKAYSIPIVFRTGGTSLSGQSITDGILVDLSKYWRKAVVESNGDFVRVQPGIIAAQVNHQLKKYQRKIGPDPASINAAMMGGILSNNSSGMCCGVKYNSYHTLEFIKFILPDGSRYNTENQGDYQRFETESAQLFQRLLQLQQQLLANTALVAKIKEKYQLKNTVGYGLNALVDFKHPLDILAHLLIGAEGTLAFIEEAVLKTLPDNAFKITGLLYFENPLTACNAIPALKASGAETLELMDRAALRSIELQADAPELLTSLPLQATAILVEYHAATAAILTQKYNDAATALHALELLHPLVFTTDAKQQAALWKLRKGMYPSVAAARKQGTTVLLEDIALPIERLGEGVLDIQQLMLNHGYDNSIIFGHAKEGNLHFVMSQSMSSSNAVESFNLFAKELAVLVIEKYNGSLKGEHGTGRQIAPFVKDEWGADAYEIMQALKNAVDPDGILNPGVLLNSDANCHITNLKTLPIVESEVDKCIECGYCENRCPSKDFTMTPRQRIVIRRAIQRLTEENNLKDKKILLQQYQYAGLDTCAVDGMCATDCPVAINTGDLVKRLRRENHSVRANKIAAWVSKNFGAVEAFLKFGLNAGNFVNRCFGSQTMHRITSSIKKILPAMPVWMKSLTGPVKMPITNNNGTIDAVYFVSCITRIMGADQQKKASLPEVVLSVAKKAGMQLFIPTDIEGNCCGQPFSSKGFAEAHQNAANQLVEKLWGWTNHGELPVLVDFTSCTQTIFGVRSYLTADNQQKFDQLKIHDSIDFIADKILPRLAVLQPKQQIVLHPVCSVYKLGWQDKLKRIADSCAIEYTIPIQAGCCGMAGDRGFYYPGLTASATQAEAMEVNEKKYDGYYASAKTCEMSLSEATGKNYQSLFYLLDEVS